MAGETRCVRPPLPCRPSKLRLLVDGTALARLELVGIHRQAHAAAGLAPLEAGGREDLVEPFGLGLPLDQAAAGHDHRLHAVGDAVAADHGGRGPQVLDPAVGARADEDAVDRRSSAIGVPGFRPMYSKAAAAAFWSVGSAKLGRIGHFAADVGHLAGIGAPGDLRLDVGGVEDLDAIVIARRDRWAAVFHRATAASKSLGAKGRPRR